MEHKDEYTALTELRNLINANLYALALDQPGFTEANYKLIIDRLQILKDRNYPPQCANADPVPEYLHTADGNGFKILSPSSHNKPEVRLKDNHGDEYDLTVQVSLKKYRYPGSDQRQYNRDASRILGEEIKNWLETRLINRKI